MPLQPLAQICKPDGVDLAEMLAVVKAETGIEWRSERRLPGGWQEGAHLLVGPGGDRAVLKCRVAEPERLLGAADLVGLARRRDSRSKVVG